MDLHDGRIISYTVRCGEREIALRIAPPAGSSDEILEVVFTGVIAYHFDGDNFGNIVFDIDERPLDEICEEYAWLFERRRGYGWPALPARRTADPLADLLAYGAKGYALTASYGMEGFVLARDMQVRAAAVPVGPDAAPIQW